MGTSLSVQPFASLPQRCQDEIPRLLINLEQVGGLGSRPNDVVMISKCDAGVRQLAAALSWEQELEDLWSRSIKVSAEVSAQTSATTEDLEQQIMKIANDVDDSLKLAQDHHSNLQHLLHTRDTVGNQSG